MAELFGNDTLDLALSGMATGADTTFTGKLSAASVGLIGNPTVPFSRDLTLDVCLANEIAYTGYAKQPVTWNKPVINPDGKVEVVGTVAEFRPTAAVNASAYGIFLVTGGTATLGFNGALDDAPVPFADTHSALVLTIRVQIGSGGITVDVGSAT